MRGFVAGAGEGIGRQLVPLLAANGHQVTAATRSPGKAGLLRRLGAEPVVADGLDAAAIGEAVARAEPEVIIHQMTALAGASSLRRFDRAFAVTNQLRTAGTDHLLAKAAAAGTRRFIAQSYTGWPNSRTGGPVKTEEDPLDPQPPSAQRESLAAIRHLERAVTAAPLAGVVPDRGPGQGQPPARRPRRAARPAPPGPGRLTAMARRWRLPGFPPAAAGRRSGGRSGRAVPPPRVRRA